MKLKNRDLTAFFESPPNCVAGVLIYGSDYMRVANKRQKLIQSLLGPKADEEMRLSRISKDNLKKSPEQAIDLCKAQGFFPGQRALLIEDANETLTDIIIKAIDVWKDGDATIIITSGPLKPASNLRKFFEQHKNTVSAPIYENPMTKSEIENMISEVGLKNITHDNFTYLSQIALQLEPGDFKQTIEKLALYKLNDETELTPQDISNCIPVSNEAQIEEVLTVVLSGNHSKISQIVNRLRSQGVLPITLVIAVARHFKVLYSIAANPKGPGTGASALRPPVYGPRKENLIKDARKWGPEKIKGAIKIITATDLQLRSPNQQAPQMALIERLFIRLAMTLKS
ncbi:MAG: DNA polymerase III subunit delta [Rhodobacteraceae bacterium TMED111]|nr:DNA polymerase III subunit delta [Marinovum sp.]OUV40874.1 MAG: DNA polymerase III subunit delta [Rhodobacteraceae bacterium TMED111]